MDKQKTNEIELTILDENNSFQHDLFSYFVANDTQEVSNTVELWESVPKYFFTPKIMSDLRSDDGLAKTFTWQYSYRGISYTVEIQPAQIKDEKGNFKAYFPGATEELVEEALKKIFTYQRHGMHNSSNKESWVRFSLSMIKKELKSRGRDRDRNSIKHALAVMSKCTITILRDGKELWSGAILQDLVTVDRGKYLESSDAYHVARFPLFISKSIDDLEYRQFNFDKFLACSEQLTRWIYKQLIHRFTNADLTNSYHFLYSNLSQNSGLLQQGSDSRNREKVVSALEELMKNKIIIGYNVDLKKKGRKIIDAKYTLTASPQFCQEQKASNKRKRNNITKAQALGLSVDNSI